MPTTALRSATEQNLVDLAREATSALDALLADAVVKVRERVVVEGHAVASLFDREQRATHGLAWLATYVEAVRQLASYAERMAANDALGELEEHLVRIGLGECLAQVVGGIPMSQGELVRPSDLGLSQAQVSARITPTVESLILTGNTAERRARLMALMGASHGATVGACGLDETLESIREEMRRFADNEVIGNAQGWHRTNSYIPMEVIAQMSDLGVFGLTIPEDFGGMGLGKESMCVVSEELSRGYIGVGSLGTRSEIAAELIEQGGTADQRERFLRGIVSGRIIPSAAFTEPNVGSDLGAIRTRAVRDGGVYRITGNKTWITHAARADLLTLLARTGRPEDGFRGLSMFLVEKPRGTESDAFPIAGLSGSEIRVLGYRGMKEYELAFDGLEVPAANLLGGIEGEGFRQLMTTFEGARIQTAARAVGVAQNALELGIGYARERQQFGKRLLEFPRIAAKVAWMAAETMAARQLTAFAARCKDSGRRSDTEAGMAKLLAARVAWSNADAGLQIHGGNGYAEEYPISRVLCDARILSVFEGTAEIQAQVIVRGLLRRDGGGANA